MFFDTINITKFTTTFLAFNKLNRTVISTYSNFYQKQKLLLISYNFSLEFSRITHNAMNYIAPVRSISNYTINIKWRINL